MNKKIEEEILKLISLPNNHHNELKYIEKCFDKILEEVSKLPKELQDEAAKIFLNLLIKHKLINIHMDGNK